MSIGLQEVPGIQFVGKPPRYVVNNAKFSDDNLLDALLSECGDKVTLLVNGSDPPYRKRFTIAHELGHHFCNCSCRRVCRFGS